MNRSRIFAPTRLNGGRKAVSAKGRDEKQTVKLTHQLTRLSSTSKIDSGYF